MSAPHRVIFDTDIGTDVDDILALAFLLGSPEITLEGVTTVYGDVGLRARMVLKLLQLRGVNGIPVHTGVGQPLLGLDPVYWPGHEGVGLLSDDDALPEPGATHAVDFLIAHVMANPGQITLLAVGPLTNVATAMVREPRLAESLKRLVIMGGRIDIASTTEGPGEHNIKCDPEAAHVVFRSGAPIELVPLDVTLRAVVRQPGVNALRGKGTPYHEALADQIARYPGFIDRGGSTFLHDPLAAMAIVAPDRLGWTPLHIGVELTGSLTRAMTVARIPDDAHPTTARVAMDLDVAGCEALIADRLAG
jgi:purine nucleosidase